MTNREQSAWSEFGRPVPTEEEVQQIVQNAAGEMWRALFSTAAKTGLRGAELRALEWQDVDLGRGLIRVRTKHGGGRDRLRSMTSEAIRVLEAVREEFAEPEGLVFCIKCGVPLSHGAIMKAFNAAQLATGTVKSSGKPKYLLHSLRLHFAVEMLRRGASSDVLIGWRGDTGAVPPCPP